MEDVINEDDLFMFTSGGYVEALMRPQRRPEGISQLSRQYHLQLADV